MEVPVSGGAAECGADKPRGGDAQMTPQLAIFLVLAAIAVAGAVNVILQRHPIHSAISLITVMIALAGLFLLLESEFIAAVQIIVYAGAIMVLFVFVIMLLNAGAEERTNMSRMARYAGVPLAIFLLIELAYQIGAATLSMTPQPPAEGVTRGVSMLLFQDFVFPFELTSILILIAILGALVLAQRGESVPAKGGQQKSS
jgi:NADH-quinone oxidoreductase subunit J